MPSKNNKLYLILGAVILFAAVAAGTWYWNRSSKHPEPVPAPETDTSELGAQIFEQAQNPVNERIPETNPFNTDTNPFDTDTNPFRNEYKNPFK